MGDAVQDVPALLHSGRTVRIDVADDTALAHGVIAADQRSALLAYVQLDESDTAAASSCASRDCGPTSATTCGGRDRSSPAAPSRSQRLDPAGPTGGVAVTGAALAEIGLWVPRRRPETILLVHIEVAD